MSTAAAVAAVAAALGAAICGLTGSSLAAAVSAVSGASLGIVGLLGMPNLPGDGGRFAIAGAAAAFAICELARAKPSNASALLAGGVAMIAGALDPSYVPVVAFAGIHLVLSWRPRARSWMYGLAAAGALATLAAMAMAIWWKPTAVWWTWSGRAGESVTAHEAFNRIGYFLGPIAASVCLFGLALCAMRGRLAGIAVVVVAAMTAIVALSSTLVPPAVPIVAGLCGGVAVGRFTAMIDSSIGQAFVGATSGFVLVAATAWPLVTPA